MTTENIQQPAPASPVEEKEFAKWLDQERNQGGSLWKSTEIWTRLNALETLYDIFRSRKELHDTEMPDNHNGADIFEAGTNAAYVRLTRASNPAPAPIVGEREDVGDINVVDIATAAIGEALQKFQPLPFNFWNMDRVEYVLQRMGELMIEKMRILYANNKRNL